MNMGLDEGMNQNETNVVLMEEKKKSVQPFAYWNVGGRDYRMRLNTSTICRLEDKLKCNLLTVLTRYGDLPPLSVMLTIAQGAMLPWEHGIKYDQVLQLFDQYCVEGGTQLSFMTDVLMPIYKVSGFFSQDQQESMDKKLEEVKTLM